jgi:hypothetical protein
MIINPYEFQPEAKTWIHVLAPTGKEKYKTAKRLHFYLPSLAECECKAGMVSLDGGILTIRQGFINDGASAVATDTMSNIAAWLVHDALYVLRNNLGRRAGFSYWAADRIYRKILRAQGTVRTRAWIHWTGLRAFGWIPRIRLLFRKDDLQVMALAFVLAALVFIAGCIIIKPDGDIYNLHRGQLLQFPTNAAPHTVNMENLQEGSNTELQGSLTGAKL